LHDYTFDSEYLTRLRARDSGTVAHFCDFFYLPVRNKIRHKSRSEDAADLVQDVFVAALKRIDAGEPEDPAKLPGYIFGICNRVILQHWSGKKSRKDVVDLDAVVLKDLRESADVMLSNELQARRVREILQRLPARYRDAINRIYFEEQGRAEIASDDGVSRANLRLILCRALKRFRAEWYSVS